MGKMICSIEPPDIYLDALARCFGAVDKDDKLALSCTEPQPRPMIQCCLFGACRRGRGALRPFLNLAKRAPSRQDKQ